MLAVCNVCGCEGIKHKDYVEFWGQKTFMETFVCSNPKCGDEEEEEE